MTWTAATLGEIAASVDYGLTASATDLPTGLKFLRITDIQNDQVDWDHVPYCQATEVEEAANRLAPGDIVFARTGATTGKSFLLRDCPERAVFASYLIRVRPSHRIDATYLSKFFQSDKYWSQIRKSARGAAQPGVNSTVLKELVVPFPPLDQQRRIAAILDQADDLRRKRRKAFDRTHILRRAAFLEMFGDPATNPNAWSTHTLGQISIRFSDGPFGSNLKSQHYVKSGVRVIRLQNIGVGEFIDEDKAFIAEEHFAKLKKHICLPGDVLIGTLGDPNLRAVIQPDYITVALNKADCVQMRSNPEICTAEYVTELLNCPSTEAMAQDKILGQTRLRISMGRLRELPVPIPPLDLQRTFGACVVEIDKLKVHHRAYLAKLDALFNSLQHRAFRGEL